MATTDNICEGLIKYLRSGDYSDLTITCGAKRYDVHKLVVCSQSTWFENAVKEKRFKEGYDDVIDFSEDEDYAVCSLVHYLYSGFYGFHESAPLQATPSTQAPTETVRGTPTATEASLKRRKIVYFARIEVPFKSLAHVNVYALADRLGLLDLKTLATQKFSTIANSQYLCEDFHRAIARVYQVAPPGPQGQALRSQAVTATVNHLTEIVRHDTKGNFAAMMAENGPFARDVALYAHGKSIE